MCVVSGMRGGKVMEEKKTRSMKKFFVIGGIGLGVLVSLALVAGFFFSPKRRVMRAIKNTYSNSALSKGNLLDEYSCLSLLGNYADVKENGGTTDLDIKVSGASSDGNLEVKISDTVNKSDKEMSGNAELLSDGKSVLSVDYLGNDKKTYLAVDDLTDGYLEFDNDDFSEKFNNSVLADSLGQIQGYNIDRFSSKSDVKKAPQQGADGQLMQIVEKLFRNAKVKSAGNGKITVDGSEVRCKKYVATIKKSDVNKTLEMMSKSKEGEKSSKQEGPSSAIGLISQLLQNQTANGQQQMQGGQQQMPGMQGGQQQGNQQKPGIQSFIESGVDQDVKLVVYISKNQVRGLSLKFSIDDEAGTDITITNRNTGSKVVTSSMDLKLALESAQSEAEIKVSLDQKSEETVDFEAELVKSGETMLEASGDLSLSADTDVKSLGSENVVKAFSDSDNIVKKAIGADNGKLNQKVQDVLEALSKLRKSQPSGGSIAGNQPGGQQQMPGGQQQGPGGQMPGYGGQGGSDYGSTDDYSYFMDPFGMFGGSSGGFGSYGYGGGMGPGMGGPGMGGMGPGMGPGMNPYTSYGDEDYSGSSDDLSEWEGSLSDSDYKSY